MDRLNDLFVGDDLEVRTVGVRKVVSVKAVYGIFSENTFCSCWSDEDNCGDYDDECLLYKGDCFSNEYDRNGVYECKKVG